MAASRSSRKPGTPTPSGASQKAGTPVPAEAGQKAGTLFLISQIGPEESDTRKRANVVSDSLIAPIAQEFKLEIVRSDRDPTPGQVTAQILRSILDARVVVADLTGQNANVYYELAFAQAFGRPLVLLVDDPETLPFDTQNERTIPLGGRDGPITFEQGTAAQQSLRQALAVVLTTDYTPRSLITDVAGVRSLEDLAPANPIATEIASVKQTVEEVKLMVRRLPTERSAANSRDIRVFTKMIEDLAKEGRLSRAEVEGLPTRDTSEGFDGWASRLAATMPEETPNVDPEDIPF